MGDFYTEQLIKKQTTMKDVFIKAFLVAIAIVSVFVVLMFPVAIIVPIIVIAAVVFLIRRLDVEYEYLYVNGDLDIDKIMHKAKRKRIFSTNIDNMELLAPEGNEGINQFRNAKVVDYSSGSADARRYVLVVADNGQVTKLVFEPNDDIIEGIFLMAPRKVVKNR
ncbi:DUF6106 family protein [Lachnospiraceae bacterium 48-42]|jgi:hypothetical protein|nr:hypothetical protein [Dorea sp.]